MTILTRKSLALLAVVAMQSVCASGIGHAQTPAKQQASDHRVWQASKFVGLEVFDESHDKIGTIRELMLNEKGQVEEVAIGTGGVLGVGGRVVAVRFDKFTWVNKPTGGARLAQNGNGEATPGANTSPSMGVQKNYPDHAQLSLTKDELNALPPFDPAK
ncbi:MAG: PRC-barrel domain-containing protein [Pseudolabrys sp.]|nr:PRC-barrel domain-containing protein [Pseudolabrys sp.]